MSFINSRKRLEQTLQIMALALLIFILAVSSISFRVSAEAAVLPCCSQRYKECDIDYCTSNQAACESCGDGSFVWLTQFPDSSCTERWLECTNAPESCCDGLTCVRDNPHYSQCQHNVDSFASPEKTPPARQQDQPPLSCSDGFGISTSWEASQRFHILTNQVSSNPYTLAVMASGGVAGDGSNVVSEGQGYGLLVSALTLVSMDSNDANYDKAKRQFEGFFHGWKKMCENSVDKSCQSTQYCKGGTVPCSPGWKHSGNLDSVVGTGSAPDADEDAIVGMILALKATEHDVDRPTWYNEVLDWADRSCTSFLAYSTVLSESRTHRIVKLGDCWGGWKNEGNNPSYHAPGHYRIMRDFQASIKKRSYKLPDLGDHNVEWTEKWNMLIETSYKFFKTTQCNGLVPNWALVAERESDNSRLVKYPGAFSSSGTYQYEFGAEASRTLWRVAFDAAAYPLESRSQAESFLAPIHKKLVENFDASLSFGPETLQSCEYVTRIFSGWQQFPFIYGPVYSTLVSPTDNDLLPTKTFTQQDMVNAACSIVGDNNNNDYYPLSWSILSQLILNGEVSRAGQLLNGARSDNFE